MHRDSLSSNRTLRYKLVTFKMYVFVDVFLLICD